MIKSEKMTQDDIKVYIDENLRRNASGWFPVGVTDNELWAEHMAGTVPHSDLNAARRIFDTFKHLINYVPGTKEWHVWNGIFHERIDGDLLAQWLCTAFVDAHRRALATVKTHYQNQASILTGDAKRDKMREYERFVFKEHREYRDKIHSNTGLNGLVTQIKNIFSVPDTFFVEDRQWLVLDNGVLDLHDLRDNPVTPGDLVGLSARLLEHDPARPVYRAVNARLDPYAYAPRWQQFIGSSLPDPELRRFLAVITGAAFFGASKTKVVPVLKGPRDSGKTIFITTMDMMAGDYGKQPDVSALVKGKGDTNFEQDTFKGVRFIGMSEPDTDRKVDDSFVKKLTGGDVMTSRNLHTRSVDWVSQGILFIATNNHLKFNTSDKALLTRFATIIFPYQFWDHGDAPEGQEEHIKDMSLERDLPLEYDGILNWVLNGMLVFLWDRQRIEYPASVQRDRHNRYVQGSSVHSWIEEAVRDGNSPYILEGVGNLRPKTHYASLSNAHLDYCSWCAVDYGDTPLGKRIFSAQLQEYLGVELVKSGELRIPRLVYRNKVEAEVEGVGVESTDNF